jgi:hypothetical protein
VTYDQSVPNHSLSIDPLKPPRHSKKVVDAYYKRPGSGKLNQALYKSDYQEWLLLRESARQYGYVGDPSINHRTPAPKVAPAAPPVEEPALSLAECHEITRGNVTKFQREEPIKYLVYVQSLAAHGRGVSRVLDPEMQKRVDALSNQLRAEKQAKEKTAKLTEFADRRAALDKEEKEAFAPKEKLEPTKEPDTVIDWAAEEKASAARQADWEKQVAEAERLLALIKTGLEKD